MLENRFSNKSISKVIQVLFLLLLAASITYIGLYKFVLSSLVKANFLHHFNLSSRFYCYAPFLLVIGWIKCTIGTFLG